VGRWGTRMGCPGPFDGTAQKLTIRGMHFVAYLLPVRLEGRGPEAVSKHQMRDGVRQNESSARRFALWRTGSAREAEVTPRPLILSTSGWDKAIYASQPRSFYRRRASSPASVEAPCLRCKIALAIVIGEF
jgi:hypothetical protein